MFADLINRETEMEIIKADAAFTTPIMHFKIENGVALAKEFEAEAYRMRKKDKGVSKSNRGGWHSSETTIHSVLPCFEKLRQQILGSLKAIGKMGSKPMLGDGLNLSLNGWININPTGGYNAPHQHPGSQWSGVFYVTQPPVAEGDSGVIEFLDPRTDLADWRILRSPWFANKRKLRPAAGDMVVFPSYLTHWVHPNETKDDRISIAWNATLSQAQKK